MCFCYSFTTRSWCCCISETGGGSRHRGYRRGGAHSDRRGAGRARALHLSAAGAGGHSVRTDHDVRGRHGARVRDERHDVYTRAQQHQVRTHSQTHTCTFMYENKAFAEKIKSLDKDRLVDLISPNDIICDTCWTSMRHFARHF